MSRVYIGIGSNIDPERNILEAVRQLQCSLHLTSVSTFYLTEPECYPDQPKFINGVVSAETDLSPEDLKFNVLRCIEHRLGRQCGDNKYAPRTIDLDILLYGQLIVQSDNLVIPDPDISNRPFYAIPLCELEPDLVLPGSGIPVCDLAKRFTEHNMTPLPVLTKVLRAELAK